MAEKSGAQWCARFPTSTRVEDLAQPFQGSAAKFIQALRDAGASVSVSATYRPPERAHLMHYCSMLASNQIAAADIPAMAGVDIDWSHGGNAEEARAAALAMMQGYGIVFPAALVSRHTQRRAIDMTITFRGAISVKDAQGKMQPAAALTDLWPIGASYGVHKLQSDPPHWSDDGH